MTNTIQTAKELTFGTELEYTNISRERAAKAIHSVVGGTIRYTGGGYDEWTVIAPDGRKRSHTFHRVLMRSAAKLHYQQAQDAVTTAKLNVESAYLSLYTAYNQYEWAKEGVLITTAAA